MVGGIFPPALNVEVQKWHIYVVQIALHTTFPHAWHEGPILYVYGNTNSEKC